MPRAHKASQPIRNEFQYPIPVTGNSATTSWSGGVPNVITTSVQTVLWSERKVAYRATWTSRSLALGDIGPSLVASWVVANRGNRVTLVWDVVVSQDITAAAQPELGNVFGGTATIVARTPSTLFRANVPARQWITFDIGAGVTSIGTTRSNMASLPLVDGVYAEVSNIILYQGEYQPSRRYYDGESFGWKWDGTSRASSSVGYPESLLMVRNLFFGTLSGQNFNGNTNMGTPTIETTGGPGGRSFRRRISSVDGNRGNWGPYAGLGTGYIQGGKAYTASIWIRVSFTQPFRLGFEVSGGSTNYGTPVTPTPGVWTRITHTYTPSTTAGIILVLYGSAVATVVTGDTFDIDRFMITEGTTLYEYSDGDTPHWHWDGTAGASSSVGYPYTLESVAGSGADQVNLVPNSVVTAPSGDAFSGRTFYAVYETKTLTTTARGISGWGNPTVPTANSATPGMALRTGSMNLNQMTNRTEMLNGSGAGGTLVSNVSSGRVVGLRSAICGWMEPGAGQIGVRTSAGTSQSVANVSITGGGIPNRNLSLIGDLADGAGIAAYAFETLHNATVRNEVLRWLANKYGFTLAT